MAMKLKPRVIGMTIIISLILLTWLGHHIIKYFLTEKLVPFDEELNANDEDFIELEYYDSKPLSMSSKHTEHRKSKLASSNGKNIAYHDAYHEISEISYNKSHFKSKGEPLSSSSSPYLIHFLEGHGHVSLSARFWCTIESACRVNPNASVTLHMRAKRLLQTPVMLAVIKNFSNLRIVTLDEQTMFSESPLKQWYKEKRWQQSHWPISHFNDAVRWLILYRYRGIYLDLDSLSVRPITPPQFPYLNFGGLESNQWVGAGVLGVSSPHHWLPQACLHSLANNFDPSEWGSNGPKLLTRILSERCGLQVPHPATPLCDQYKVLDTQAFYPIPWWAHYRYMEPVQHESLSAKLLSDPNVRIIHVWQHLTKDTSIFLNGIHKKVLDEDNSQVLDRRMSTVLKELTRDEYVIYSGVYVRNTKILNQKMVLNDPQDTNIFFQPIAAIVKEVCSVTVSIIGEIL